MTPLRVALAASAAVAAAGLAATAGLIATIRTAQGETP